MKYQKEFAEQKEEENKLMLNNILKDIKKEFEEMGFEVLKDDVINYLDIRSFDEVVEDNLNYYNIGDFPIEYINLEKMVHEDNDYTQVGNMYWKNTFFIQDSEDKPLIKLGLIKKL